MTTRTIRWAQAALALSLAGLLQAQDEGASRPKPKPSEVQQHAKAARAKSAEAKKREETAARAKARAKAIDLNTASRAQLKQLPGVDDLMADRILAGRPYKVKTDLVTKDVMPHRNFLAIKDRVVAKPPAKP